MFGSAIIVLRETLEAALVISVLLAAVSKVPRARLWIAGGVASGLLAACAVALFAGRIADALEGAGQEYFNAAVLLAATIMLGWHNVWMTSHGRELSQNLHRAGEQVASGASPLSALLIVVALAVMREGSEVVLFLYGIAVGGADNQGIFVGGVLGLLSGAAIGAVAYAGLVRIPQRQLFAITGWMLLFLAAGMAGQAANYLVQTGALPALVEPLWDLSRWLPERQTVGQLLHLLIGYSARPSAMQIIFWLVSFVAIRFMSVRAAQRVSNHRRVAFSTSAASTGDLADTSNT